MQKLFLLLAFVILIFPANSFAAEDSPKTGYFVTSDGVKLRYIEAGKGSAILFEPGWTMSAEIWEKQIDYFAKNYHVVAIDPRSQGESDKPSEGHYPERRARDIKELVDHLKLAPVTLVGWSMGVAEALTYVELFGTDSLSGLVLVDGFIGRDQTSVLTVFQGFLKSLQTDRKKFTENFVRGMYSKKYSEDYLEKVMATSLKTPTNSAVVLFMNTFMKDYRPILEKIDKPLLALYTPFLKDDAGSVKQKVPSAKVELFDGAGHALFVDEADKFNKLLEQFIKDYPSK
ncbi:MAG: alpha/beta hydrolase [Blastocatellia bacterium]|nr:alpha/beta hydrolase [Blastocatellia bacterium]